MADSVIDLAPSMQRRLNFDHDLLDNVDDYKLPEDEIQGIIASYLLTHNKRDRDALILSFMWLAKDVVCRYRAHWPTTIPITDDLASEALSCLTEYIDKVFKEGADIYNGIQSHVRRGLRNYINDNRSIFGASRTTNERRMEKGESLEYNFASQINDEICGVEITDPLLVDIMDSIEAISDIDNEELYDLVVQFLYDNHNISEGELTDEERQSLERLTEIVRNAAI